MVSGGRYRAGALSIGVILANAFSFNVRSACTCIWVVSMLSCLSQSAMTVTSTPACRSLMAAVWRRTCGDTTLDASDGQEVAAASAWRSTMSATP